MRDWSADLRRKTFRRQAGFTGPGLLMKITGAKCTFPFHSHRRRIGRDGIELVSPLPWLWSSHARPGFHLGRALSEEEMSDVEYGFRIAKATSQLEIGQWSWSRKDVLAVEAHLKERKNASLAVASWREVRHAVAHQVAGKSRYAF